MQPPLTPAFPLLQFLGVVVQFGGTLMLIALFLTLRRFVLRRAYFSAWAKGWIAFAAAILALIAWHLLAPSIGSTVREQTDPITRMLFLAYQAGKVIGYVFFVRGTVIYLAGTDAGVRATRRLWLLTLLFAVISATLTRHGLTEIVVWQSGIAIPCFVYCAWALLSLPRPRRTAGSAVVGVAFALLASLWAAYAVAFTVDIRGTPSIVLTIAGVLASLNSYFDLTLYLMLGYSMILLLMEDAKREVDDAQAELRLTHDRLRRAALYDSLTDSLNRRAFTEGMGLEMARAAFGTVVIADLDNLKRVNDEYGHAVGDQLICRCAEVLRGALRAYDKLYRWGGDEFLLVLPSAHASNVLGRLRRAIDSAEPVTHSATGALIGIQVSLGTADYASSEELAFAIERADQAMYREKGTRKGSRHSGGEGPIGTPTSARAVR
jgi:diguanylate cyclase (GGDEF) domain